MEDTLKFSIVTVVYNGEKTIEQTILSIINQSYKNIEYIIVDGNSEDKTLEIIERYKDKITKIVSEKDNGLYDAMNKSFNLATGDYIWFINSGDEIFTSYTISDIVKKIEKENILPDIMYGRTALYNNNKELIKVPRVPKKIDSYTFTKGMPVSHQGFIVSKKIVEYYNLNYKSASDQDWIIRLLKKTRNVFNLEMIVSKYILGGSSYKNFLLNWKERLKIIKSYFNFYYYFKNLFIFILNYIKFLIKQQIFKKPYIFKQKGNVK